MYIRVRFHIIRNAYISNVGKYQSCMVSELRIILVASVSGEQVGVSAKLTLQPARVREQMVLNEQRRTSGAAGALGIVWQCVVMSPIMRA